MCCFAANHLGFGLGFGSNSAVSLCELVTQGQKR